MTAQLTPIDRTRLPGPAPDATPEEPWLGLRPFSRADREYFFGRDDEIKELFERIAQRLLTVLFGQSGLGKTSLLCAGVIPRLTEAEFQPILVRLIHDPAINDASLEEQVLTEVARVFPDLGAEPPVRAPSLWQLFHDPVYGFVEQAGTPASLRPVLILEQFEEIFTLGESKRPADAVKFMEALCCLVENRAPPEIREQLLKDDELADRLQSSARPCRVLIALRDDYLHLLERWRQKMPSMMENRFELRQLSGKQAFRAVYEPGTRRTKLGNKPPIVSPETAAAIVRLVAGKGPEAPLEEIENVPPLLSLICQQLNARRLREGRETLQAEEVSASAEEVLRDFCARCFASQRPAVREFVEHRLISRSGFRESVTLETAITELHQAGVAKPEATFRELVSQRLLTIEDRGGIPRIELTHDILAPVISRSRDQWTSPESLAKVEEIWRALGDESDESRSQQIVRRLFSALCETDGRGLRVRRTSTLTEVAAICQCDPSVVRGLAEKFSVPGCRLLVMTQNDEKDETEVELIHGSLIANWTRLAQWIAREEQTAGAFRDLVEAMKNQADRGLLSGAMLDDLLKMVDREQPNAAWADRYAPGAFEESLSFLRASRAKEQERRQAEEKRLQRELEMAHELAAARESEAREKERRAGEAEAAARAFRRRTHVAVLLMGAAIVFAGYAGWSAYTAWMAERRAATAESAAVKERRQAENLLEQNLELYTWPTDVGGDIIVAMMMKHDLARALQPLQRGDRPYAATPDVRRAIAELDAKIQGWKPTAESEDELQHAVLRLAVACRKAWDREQEKASRYLDATAIARQHNFVVGLSFARVIDTTRRLADRYPDSSRSDLREFERLYWSELVFLETDTIEDLMIQFRKLLRNAGTEKSHLIDTANQIEKACNAEIKSTGEESRGDFDERLAAAKKAYDQQDFVGAREQFLDLFLDSLHDPSRRRDTILLAGARVASDRMIQALQFREEVQSPEKNGKAHEKEKIRTRFLDSISEANSSYPESFGKRISEHTLE